MHKYHASASFPYTTLSWWETFHVSGHHVFVTSLNKSIKVFFCVSAVNCPVQVKIKLTTSSERPSPRTNKLCATKLFKTKDIVQTRNATKTPHERSEKFLTWPAMKVNSAQVTWDNDHTSALPEKLLQHFTWLGSSLV